MKNLKKIIVICMMLLIAFGAFTVSADYSATIYVTYDENATENIRRAILQADGNGGAERIVLSNQGEETTVWTASQVSLTDNIELYIKANTTLQAQSGAFTNERKSFVNVIDKENIAIIGENSETSKIAMNKEEYQSGEWRHAINIVGGKNIDIKTITIEKSGGDGINIAGKDALTAALVQTKNENILIENVICDKNARNGISVISGDNITIKNSVLKNTGIENPQDETGNVLLASGGPWAGIDVEPEDYAALGDVIITGCEFDSNRRVGLEFNYSGLLNSEDGTNITVSDCRIADSPSGIIATGRDGVRSGFINISDSVIANTTSNGIWVKKWSKDLTALRFTNSALTDPVPASEKSVIYIDCDASEYENGNISFNGLYVFGKSGDGSLCNVTGHEAYPITDITGTIYTDGTDKTITQTNSDISVSVMISDKTKEEFISGIGMK